MQPARRRPRPAIHLLAATLLLAALTACGATPTPNPTATGKIALGGYHTAAVSGGVLYTWGYNYYGQLGDTTSTDRTTPTFIPTLPSQGDRITAIALGSLHTAALLDSGALYTWGYDLDGQLGDGAFTDQTTPTAVPNFPPPGTRVTAIALGGDHTAALLDDGTLHTWGANFAGQLGDGTTTVRRTPTPVPNFPPTGFAITAIALGSGHTAALLDNGTLYVWGYNADGELGDGTTTNRTTPTLVPNFPPPGTHITAMALGGYHTAALLDDGTLYTWGRNTDGQLGDTTTTNRTTPTLVRNFPPPGTRITAIALGSLHSAALLDDGAIYTWGDSLTGQLGDGTTTDRYVPTLVPGGFRVTSARP